MLMALAIKNPEKIVRGLRHDRLRRYRIESSCSLTTRRSYKGWLERARYRRQAKTLKNPGIGNRTPRVVACVASPLLVTVLSSQDVPWVATTDDSSATQLCTHRQFSTPAANQILSAGSSDARCHIGHYPCCSYPGQRNAQWAIQPPTLGK